MKASKLLISVMLLFALRASGQDTARRLNHDQFISIVKAYHPVVRQAALQVERAEAGVQSARGAFDPALSSQLDRKTFDGKRYYSYFSSQLTIPTWYGIDIKAGIEEVVGDRVTSEATLGQTSYLGLKVPVNSLLFDSRRSVLRQAQSFRQLSEAQRQLMINDLLCQALGAYWDWVRDYGVYEVLTSGVRINEDRLKFVRVEYEQGARPAIDTIEARAQLLQSYLQQSQAWLAFRNSGLELSAFLWTEAGTPVEWCPDVLPPSEEVTRIGLPALDELLARARAGHPKLLGLASKIEVLQTERRLKGQYLLPKLSINANLLSKGYGAPSEVSGPFLERNYKLGIDFQVPLLMREARGEYRSAGIKMEETGLERDQTVLSIENKVRSYYNEAVQTEQQILIYEQALANCQRLLGGERLRFEAGESTLFLLNSRENKVLETAQKLSELKAKWQKSVAALLWAAGQLY